MWIDHLPLAIFLRWLRGVMSEPDGTPSSTRVLLFVFSLFSLGVIGYIVYHVTHITDVVIIGIFLSNLPLLIASLMGLISLPYGINKGSATFSDIANMITAAKNGKTGDAVGDLKAMFSGQPPATPPTAPAPTPPQATGNPGVKG